VGRVSVVVTDLADAAAQGGGVSWELHKHRMRRFVVDSVGLISFLQIVTSLIIRGEPPIAKSQGTRHICLPYSVGIYLNF
jgi:hypothetical protein